MDVPPSTERKSNGSQATVSVCPLKTYVWPVGSGIPSGLGMKLPEFSRCRWASASPSHDAPMRSLRLDATIADLTCERSLPPGAGGRCQRATRLASGPGRGVAEQAAIAGGDVAAGSAGAAAHLSSGLRCSCLRWARSIQV